MGALANVTQDGFGPAAFHSYPSTLAIDGYVGDYGSGFYGYTVNSSTYIVKHPEFGWLAFSGNLKQDNDRIRTEITTAGKNRVFLSPESLAITTVSGQIKEVDYNPKTGDVNVEFIGDAFVEISALNDKNAVLPANLTKDSRGYYEVKAKKGKKNILNIKM